MQPPAYGSKHAADAINGVMQTLGSRLRGARHNLGLSQVELAARIGVTPQTVSQWEADIKRPSRANLALLSSRLGIDMAYLIFGHPPSSDTGLTEQTGTVTVPVAVTRGRVLPVYSGADAVSVSREEAQPIGRVAVYFDADDVDFAVEVDSASNAPTLLRGDIAILSPSLDAVPGDLVLAAYGKEPRPVLGRLRYETLASGVVTVVAPEDGAWPAARSDHDELRVTAVLVGSLRIHRQRR